MADKEQDKNPEAHIGEETPAAPPTPAPATEDVLQSGDEAPTPSESGDVVVDHEKIDELMAQRKAAAREKVEQEEPPAPEVDAPAEGHSEPVAPDAPAVPDDHQEWEKPLAEIEAEQKKPRRGRPPKEDKGDKPAPEDGKAAKPRRGRPPKGDKAATDEPKPPVRDKVSRGGKKTAPVKEEAPAPTPEPAPEPGPPPRPIDEGKLVYLKLTELHPFHTFRNHPYKVTDDEKMAEMVGTIKELGVMSPATVRPEKDGSGYEIIAGHRRHHGSGLAGLEEMPCIVRDMTDLEAVKEMKISNKQRGEPLPSELARLLDLEVEAIKHQGGRLDGVAAGDVGKRSVEIVGENNGMNYKKVMRYIRLNSLVPELQDMADAKKLGFMPAVEISYIKPKNQRLIAVSIEGEQSSPSLTQAQELRKLDKEGRLNGDVIDGILSQQKKEVDKVIISTAELNNYFGRDKTPREMKDQIIALLDDWKSKQPPELTAPEKKADLEK